MRAGSLSLVLLLGFGASACKARDDLALVAAAGEARGATPGACGKLDGAGVISAQKLAERSANPDCRTKFLALPLTRQSQAFTCGVASLQSILFYYGDEFSEPVLQRILKAGVDTGTSYRRIIAFVRALNAKKNREKFDNVSSFQQAMAVSDLRTVLKDPAVVAAIKKRAKTWAFQSVLDGIERLDASDVDIDALGGAALALAGGADGVGGTQNMPPKTSGLKDGKYEAELFVNQTLFTGAAGESTAGCEAGAPAAGPFQKNGMTVPQLEASINAGNPILALTQAWTFLNAAEYDVNAYENGWASGHYVVIVGYDEDNFYLMDPSTLGTYAFVPRAEFLKRWHDYDGALSNEYKRCPGGVELRNFGLVIRRGGGPTFQRDQVVKMF